MWQNSWFYYGNFWMFLWCFYYLKWIFFVYFFISVVSSKIKKSLIWNLNRIGFSRICLFIFISFLFFNKFDSFVLNRPRINIFLIFLSKIFQLFLQTFWFVRLLIYILLIIYQIFFVKLSFMDYFLFRIGVAKNIIKSF